MNRLRKRAQRAAISEQRAQQRLQQQEQPRPKEPEFSLDDRISFMDCYRMSYNLLSYPNRNYWAGIFIAGMIFAIPWGFDFAYLSAPFFVWDWKVFLCLLTGVYVLFSLIAFTRAFRLYFACRSASFHLQGWGMFLRNTPGPYHYRKVLLVLRTSSGFPDRKEKKDDLYTLVCHHANRKLRQRKMDALWTITDRGCPGYLNWKTAGTLLLLLCQYAREAHLKSAELRIPSGERGQVFEWIPEGD